MRRNRKPAIASEWKENKAAQDLADENARAAAEAAAVSVTAERPAMDAVGSVSLGLQGLLTGIGWIGFFALAVFLASSLLSYSPADPGFSVTAHTASAANVCGIFGAWIADFLYWFFGLSVWWTVAWLVLASFLCLRLICARGDSLAVESGLPRTFLGFILLLVSTAGFASLQMAYLGTGLPNGAGGLVGYCLAREGSLYLGFLGASIVLLILFALGLSRMFFFSWLGLAERIGTWTEKLFGQLLKIRLPRIELRRRTPDAGQAGVVADAAAGTGGDSGKMPEPPSAGVAERVEPTFRWPSRAQEVQAAQAEDNRTPAGGSAPVPVAPVADAPMSEKEAGPKQSELFPRPQQRIQPTIDALAVPPAGRRGITEDAVQFTSRLIESKLKTYHIDAEVKGAQAGPVITQYWLELAPGVKGSRVEDIRKDLTRSLSVQSVRIVPVIPGKPYMGLEIPNNSNERQPVYLREIIGSEAFEKSRSLLSLAFGKDIAGVPVVEDLARLPHLLVGGTTGSGKSVCINTMILSLLYKCDPSQLRLVLIDPKTVEFALYQDIPHLLAPVVTDMSKAANALNWLVNEMDRRYSLMSRLSVRSFDSFNAKVGAAWDSGEPIMDPFDVSPQEPEPHVPLRRLPYIVCFIDELADLILTNRKQIELYITRLAQKARAAGIHLVLATQRPSADVVTSLIKANIAARVCFQVAGRFDSLVVLDESGAQDLLGRGDMLFRKPGRQTLTRVQGCMVEEAEILGVVEELRSQGSPQYVDAVTEGADMAPSAAGGAAGGRGSGEKDVLYDEAVQMVVESGRVSTSSIQRRLNIGYNRAANIVETMEEAGIISRPSATGKREVLVRPEGGNGE